LDHAIELVISAILFLCSFVLEAVGVVDGVLGSIMTRIGVPPGAQIALLLGISVILVVFAIRKLGMLFAALIIVLLVLLLMHKALPGITVSPPNIQIVPPAAPAAPGTVHT